MVRLVTSPQVKIYVGAEEKLYLFPRDLIAFYSPYFARESSLAPHSQILPQKADNAADVSFFKEDKGVEAIAGLVRRNYNLAAIMMCHPPPNKPGLKGPSDRSRQRSRCGC